MTAPVSHVIYLVAVLSSSLSASAKEHSVHINFRYPLQIDTIHGKYEGRICSSMARGALVQVEPEVLGPDGACGSDSEEYLRIEIRNWYWPLGTRLIVEGTTNQTTNTTTDPPAEPKPTRPPSISDPIALPARVVFDVKTALIDVNNEYELVVSQPKVLGKLKELQFYVVLVASDTQQVVSNPIPFLVRVDRSPDEGRPHGAAMFAGVLLLAIIIIALLIPVTVCVKRRRKAGKAVCTCCGRGAPDVEKQEGRGQVNNAYIPEPRDTKSISSDSSEDPKQTIGSHQLRTVSDFHFKPAWLDPHFKELDVIPEGTSHPELTTVQEECRL